jgi:hypothetical protein
MGFKDMVAADRAAVFIDPAFFGEEYRIEGKRIAIVVDTDELKERQGGQDLAVAESGTLFYAREEDLPPRRAPGQSLNINGRECIVDDWKVDMGIATVVLRENIIA